MQTEKYNWNAAMFLLAKEPVKNIGQKKIIHRSAITKAIE